MTAAPLTGVVRRLWPRRMRTRLAVFYSLLFLLAGAALLALTYVLVSNVLLPAPNSGKPIPARLAPLLALCKPLPSSRPLLRECKQAIAAVSGGPNGPRLSALVALQTASLIGLGVLVIVSAGLG
ncbi:MAG: hypothetical protein ACRDL8_07025, partial [Solirubrobacteraceae bacterium]